jgi:CBS domain-containing protein
VQENLEALVILNGQKKIAGVLDRKDMIQALLDRDRSDASLEPLARRDFQTIDRESYFFEALHEMVKHKTSFLVVLKGEEPEGLLTSLDLLRFRGREALSLIRNIENATGLDQLYHWRLEAEKVIRALMADGALASQVCRIVSELNDKIVRKIIQFVEERCGPEPCAYAWLGLGSEGRKEQSLFTDQDNALIIADPATDRDLAYFQDFARKVVEGLSHCGIPLCKGEVMATNPKFFGPLADWKARAAHWIRSPILNEKDLMDTYSFLDFRYVYGQSHLEQELRNHLNRLIQENPQFLTQIAEGVLEMGIPLGFFKNFIVEKNGAHKDKLNIKLSGLVPLISGIKILACKNGLAETNTLERIERLGQENILTSDQVEILTQAFETLLTLRIRNDLLGMEKRQDFENYLNPAHLSTRYKQLLKEAFWAVSEVQKIVRTRLKVRDEGISF